MSANEFYTNSDGLNIRFGLEKGAAVKQGHLSTMGDEKQAVFTITGTALTTGDVPLETHPTVGIPDGAHIISATLYVTEAFTSGGSATLTIGLMNDDGDGTFSANDADGIDATIAKTAIDAIGDHVACDGALVGSAAAAIAGTSDRPVYVSAKYGTAAFTAGVADLVIKYRDQN
tara:strand:+ start:7741 stop:8262 length:522 start_codon:yes stop_codon:yes gene_type:complete